MTIRAAASAVEWDKFLIAQQWSPFLQSWMMGEVFREIGQEPIRLEMRNGKELVGICQAIVVSARRGRHLAIQYGPLLSAEIRNPSTSRSSGTGHRPNIEIRTLVQELKKIAKEKRCSFIRMSPFVPKEHALNVPDSKKSPMHLLAEHIWFLDLTEKTEEEILKNMRQNHRNLIRRAEKEGVRVNASTDIDVFLRLHKETCKRHKFTPYTDAFFRAQFTKFSPRQCTLYVATYKSEPIAASIHMHFGGETSYHHGASSLNHPKIPASYLLQWTAISDAIKRGDRIYNFWGIAPQSGNSKFEIRNSKHPFAGVTTFKTGFGGELLELMHCVDIPVSSRYYCTRAFETVRKWRRGFSFIRT